MTTGMIHEQNMEQQIDRHMRGCMSGFFNIFDRNHALSGKRLYPKRLPSSISTESASGSASSIGSPARSGEFERPKLVEHTKSTASDDRPITPVPKTPPSTKSPATDGVKSPWKFNRETPRLSLDSQLHPRGIKTTSSPVACEDESERQRRSPSVVARLMGLGSLPSSNGSDSPEKKAELRRSASESRSRDLLHCRFTDGNVFNRTASGFATTNTRENGNGGNSIDGFNRMNGRANPEKPRRTIGQQQMRKGMYDFGDFFPEPKPEVSSIYDDIEKRLKMRGIDEPSKNLETLKHILEALQLKGLLHHHSKPQPVPVSQIGRRNFVYEQRFPYEESPIVVMRPARSPRRLPTSPRSVSGGESFSSRSPRRERTLRSLTPTSPGRSDGRNTSPAITRRKTNQSLEEKSERNHDDGATKSLPCSVAEIGESEDRSDGDPIAVAEEAKIDGRDPFAESGGRIVHRFREQL